MSTDPKIFYKDRQTPVCLHFFLVIRITYFHTDLSALLDGDSAALPVWNLPALLVRDLPAVGLGHVPAVVDGDCLAVLARLEALLLAVGG